MELDWEVWVHDSWTGDQIKQVYPQSFPWSTSLFGDGSGTATFKIDDEEHPLSRDDIWSDFRPNARMLVIRMGDFVAYAGKIDQWEYYRDAAEITVPSVELWNEWEWRLTYPLNGYAGGTLVVTNRTHSGAVAAILTRGMQWSAEWQYPIDLPADAPGGFSATWEFFKKLKIADLLEQIRDEGYEVYLRPYLTSAQKLRFQTRVEQRITIGVSSFNLQADQTPLSKVSYKVDGSRQLTGLQGVGNGSGQDQAVAYVGATSYLIPIRDAKQDFPDLTGDSLQAATNASFAYERNPIAQWSIGQFQIDETWGVENVLPGRAWQIDTLGDAVIPDDRHLLRVISCSGALDENIQTEVQSVA